MCVTVAHSSGFYIAIWHGAEYGEPGDKEALQDKMMESFESPPKPLIPTFINMVTELRQPRVTVVASSSVTNPHIQKNSKLVKAMAQ